MSEVFARLVEDCILFNLSEQDSLDYIKKRSGHDLSARQYYRIKRGVENDPAIQFWLDRFTRIGFVIKHKQRIEEMEKLQQITWRLLNEELARPEFVSKEEKEQGKRPRNYSLINSWSYNIRENDKRLEELTHGTPTIAQIKKLIEDGKRVSGISENSSGAVPESGQ